ncbi:MAG: hypothetical protein QF903_07575 [Planctomycetota bacterium]|nr:hypothetical protein [Planctomycetota bacterium]MDP6761929.1 hypothetical protein [Planctomycetota bacterium]MDP6989326.1 hypothetical protein [Planctomycetota bacterium]
MARLEEELDWERLGRCYCSEGGEAFFPPAQREAVRDAGLLLASDVAAALAGRDGSSLYLGAALAELAPMLCERLVLGRGVVAVNLPCEETDELNRALDAVSETLDHDLGTIETVPLESLAGAGFDHGWLVSVLTDPDAFPALHDELYERGGTALATGRGDPAEDRQRAGALVGGLLDALSPPCLLTTTDEELAILKPACERRGWRLESGGHARLSAVVGDPVRICRAVRTSQRQPTADGP